MATNESASAEADAQSTSMNSIAVQAIRQGIAEQASRQKEFQLSVRVKAAPDEESVKAFRQDLVEFIESAAEADDVGISEIAIALWGEVNRMERMVREASDGMDGDEAAHDDGNDGDAVDASAPIAQSSMDDGEDAESEADPGLPEDPAFH